MVGDLVPCLQTQPKSLNRAAVGIFLLMESVIEGSPSSRHISTSKKVLKVRIASPWIMTLIQEPGLKNCSQK